jgi:hypothetical protein
MLSRLITIQMVAQEFRTQKIKDFYKNFEHCSVTDFIKVKNFQLQFNAYMMTTMQIH